MFTVNFYRAACLLCILLMMMSRSFCQAEGDTSGNPRDQAPSDSFRMRLEGPEINAILDRAIHFQIRADSFQRVAIEWRKEAAVIDDPVARGRFQKRIIVLEDSLEVLRRIADNAFMELQNVLSEIPGYEPVHPYLVRDTILHGITVYRYDLNEEFMEHLAGIREESQPPEVSPSLSGNSVKAEEKAIAEAQGEAANEHGGGPVERRQPSGEGFTVFEVTPYGPDHPFEHDFTIPPGVFYRIQLAVYRNPLPADHFGGLSPITTEAIPERDLTRYFVGKFRRMDDAREALERVRTLGFSDAFIVGYYDGVKASFSKLKVLEK
jgi:hypothetical protein